ncbi:FecR family protein [Pedobacter sp. ok626]|uniref:FecR family protein n=1 Tax=Pedobacter sp. ok626 TaxID=1761882 RepID=UPI000885D204|nr:FecR family protein [Pedobacter sp. ok626]SDL65001.1 FecR family protein [Pedobacter sp. ok626]
MEYLKEKELISSYLDGTCSPQEKERLEQWYILRNIEIRDELPDPEYQVVKSDIWESIQTKTEPAKKRYPFFRIASAAAILMVLGIGFYFYNVRNTTPDKTTYYASKINPGKTGATLTLANGNRIALDKIQNGKLIAQAGIEITKTAEGRLSYEVKGTSGTADASNTLSTSRGQTYQVRLPDGSLVWLNSASSLTYTTALLNQGKRKVKLTGEGYFEVTKNKNHPFIVETNGQEVEVLGTHFNINSYQEEGKIVTTLQEGSVRVSATDGKKISSILKPGQQSLLSSSGIQVLPADLETALAWKNGRLEFRDADLPSIMREISRWYDIDVTYEGRLPNRRFEASVSRQANLSTLLELLKLSKVKFNIKEQPSGKKLLVLSDN